MFEAGRSPALQATTPASVSMRIKADTRAEKLDILIKISFKGH
jgi:hypothetical protein